jgi:hypothetical protein
MRPRMGDLQRNTAAPVHEITLRDRGTAAARE